MPIEQAATYVSQPDTTPLDVDKHIPNGIDDAALPDRSKPKEAFLGAKQRSMNTGQYPTTPRSQKSGHGNSKSCPPGKPKPSPGKDMVKKPPKSGRDMCILSDFFVPKTGKAGTPRGPLRRAGMPNAAAQNKFSPGDPSRISGLAKDVPMIDVDKVIAEEEKQACERALAEMIREQAEAVQSIRDAGEKWSTHMPVSRRNEIENLAIQFLLSMNSTLCFFTVALRMIGFAPWKDSLVATDVRQSAVVAISKGWYVALDHFSAYPFTRAELALAAGSYLGQITPTISEDATVALRTIVECLPIACDSFFTKVRLCCPFCGAEAQGAAPIFCTAVTWKDDKWIDLKTTLQQARPFISSVPPDWHAPACRRNDAEATHEKLGLWVYLEFRPYPLYDAFFPPLSETAPLLSDTSLRDQGLELKGLVCSNLEDGKDRHYWFIEYEHGHLRGAYDSLKGLQRVTSELYKSLSVTGLLLVRTTKKKPTLRTGELDAAAGQLTQVERRPKPIHVAGRSASQQQRKALMPKPFNSKSSGAKPLTYVSNHAASILGKSAEGTPQKTASKSPSGKGDPTKRAHKPYVKSFEISPKGARRTHSVRKGHGKRYTEFQVSSNAITEQGADKARAVATEDNGDTARGENVSQPSQEIISPQNQGHQDHIESFEGDEHRKPSPSDPISLFSSPENELLPRGSGKRSFEEVDRGSRESEHGSLEDQLRRDKGPPGQVLTDFPVPTEGFNHSTACPRAHVGGLYCNEGTNGPLPQCLSEQRNHITPSKAVKNPTNEVEQDSACLRAQVQSQFALGSAGGSTLRCPQESTNIGEERGVEPSGAGGDLPKYQEQNFRGYGVISLFDGVSSVVPLITKKFGYAPTVAILAENDTALRTVACAEFGYRADEQWGYTPQGTAALYLKDVHSLIANHCQVLRKVVEAYPNLKWIIAGGSPCQDLTFAGPHKRLLGLAGPNSRLFFVFLCVIFAIQQLCGPGAVRFLAENAASMLEFHYLAFCKLLNINPEPSDGYLWNPASIGYEITRRRNFFRNFNDCERITSPTRVFGKEYGPLIKRTGELIPLAPLLRTRATFPNGIVQASWTLYQPHALVWDYTYWGGKEAFTARLDVGPSNLPHCDWDAIVPPPFLESWQTFIALLESRSFQGSQIDTVVASLIPMMHTGAYHLPFRVLQIEEIVSLSGLQHQWSNVSLDDAELITETWIRNACGNCFHPDLVSSALGNNIALHEWVQNRTEGPKGVVADKKKAYEIFAQLCQQIEEEAQKRGSSRRLHLDKTLPSYEEPFDASVVANNSDSYFSATEQKGSKPGQPAKGLPHGLNPRQIHPAPALPRRVVKVTQRRGLSNTA